METATQGKFFDSLKRSNSKIREDRALDIAEDAQLTFKREVEDLEMEIKKMERERDGMLDMSPTTADSLVLASDFKAKDFVTKDIELGVKIRQAKITLDIAKERYQELFGTPKTEGVAQ